MRRILIVSAHVIALAMLSSAVKAQEPVRQDLQSTPRQTKPLKPAPEQVDKHIQTTPNLELKYQMARARTSLSTKISVLTDELKKLRRETERNAGMMELLLNEDRLARAEDKTQAAHDYKAQLDAREQDFLRRQKNIQVEVVMRGGLRRDEAEAAIRAELQRGLEDTRNQQLIYQQRITELNEQAVKLRARIDKLKKKMEGLDEEK